MESRLQTLHEDVFSVYSRLASTTQWASKQALGNSNNLEYLADIAFAMYELDKLLKDIGVEVRKCKELAETLACVTWSRQLSDEPIRTDHCTATPQLKLQPAMPKKTSEEYGEMLDWLGIKENRDVVRVHWPTLCDIVTQCVEESKPLPKWVNPEALHNPSGTLRFYKKKDVPD